MSTERILPDDKALWRSLATPPPAESEPVSDMDFAAWLDGQLPEAAAARIDAALAADPALRLTALELADILGKPLPAASPRMVGRAQGLVGAVAGGRPARRSWLAVLLPDFAEGFGFQRGALAATAVAVAAVGFMLGGGLSQRYENSVYAASQSSQSNGTTVTPFRDTTGDLNDLFTDAT
jgi:hypothetical protein